MQSRVTRVGLSLIPAFQRALPEGDPFKINFQFFAIEAPKLRGLACSPRGGLVFIPRRMVERFKDDSQLAGALAICVAAVIQQERMTFLMRQEPYLRDELVAGALIAALIPSPVSALVLEATNFMPDSQSARRWEEQRGRIALALMFNAGYDPWIVPETVRLMASRELPQDLNTLKYPDLGGYMLGILHLQYPKPAKSNQAELHGQY